MGATAPHVAGQPSRFKNSEALLQAILDNAAVGMVLAGTDGRLLYANKAYRDTFGYQAEEIVGLGVQNLVHPDDRAGAAQQLQALTDGTVERYRAERRYVRKDGSVFWGLVSASLLRDRDNARPAYTILQA